MNFQERTEQQATEVLHKLAETVKSSQDEKAPQALRLQLYALQNRLENLIFIGNYKRTMETVSELTRAEITGFLWLVELAMDAYWKELAVVRSRK